MPSPILEASVRNKFEASIAEQLTEAGVVYDYEGLTLHFDVPARKAKYRPDFPCTGTPIILEAKGWFGGTGPGASRDTSAKVRKNLCLVKAQHPELDIRFIFHNPNTKIYKGSPTTQAQWAEDHGFKWCKKVVPPEWIAEIKKEQKLEWSRQRSIAQAADPRGSKAPRTGAGHSHKHRPRAPNSRSARQRAKGRRVEN
jgi:Phage endonuclease I